MHQMKPDIEALAQSILTYSMDRLRMDPPSIDHPLPQTDLRSAPARPLRGKVSGVKGHSNSLLDAGTRLHLGGSPALFGFRPDGTLRGLHPF